MRLVVASGGASGRVLDLADQDVVIGRDEGCDLVLADDDQVSRRHARLSPQPDGTVRLVDLGSSNGTFVGGERIADAATLRGGEEIRIGHTALRVEGTSPATTLSERTPGTIVTPRPAPPPAAAPPSPPPPPAVAAYQPPPPPPPRQPWWKSRWSLVAIVAALLAAGGTVGGVLATRGDGEGAGTTVVETETTVKTVTVAATTPPPDTGGIAVDTGTGTDTSVDTGAAVDQVLAQVPDSYRSSCTPVDAGTEVAGVSNYVAGVFCTAQNGITVFHLLMPSKDAMDQAYSTGGVAGDPRDQGQCGTDERSEGPYTINNQNAGRLVCFPSANGGVAAWWTHDPTLILSIAGGDNRKDLYDWWLNEAGPIG